MGTRYLNLVEKNKKKPSGAYYRVEQKLDLKRGRTSSDERTYRVNNLTGGELNLFPLNKRLLLGFGDMAILKDDWDSYGAKAPTPETIRLAKKVCLRFEQEYQPEIYPHPSGSIGLNWKIPGFNIDLNVLAGKPDKASLFMEDESGTPINLTSEITDVFQIVDGIHNLISRLMRK